MISSDWRAPLCPSTVFGNLRWKQAVASSLYRERSVISHWTMLTAWKNLQGPLRQQECLVSLGEDNRTKIGPNGKAQGNANCIQVPGSISPSLLAVIVTKLSQRVSSYNASLGEGIQGNLQILLSSAAATSFHRARARVSSHSSYPDGSRLSVEIPVFHLGASRVSWLTWGASRYKAIVIARLGLGPACSSRSLQFCSTALDDFPCTRMSRWQNSEQEYNNDTIELLSVSHKRLVRLRLWLWMWLWLWLLQRQEKSGGRRHDWSAKRLAEQVRLRAYFCKRPLSKPPSN